MKKICRNVVFVVLIFVTLLTFMFALNAVATSGTEYESCSDYYFSNLTGENVPINVEGSCGYLAMSMLLAYYDAYWNDNFVADNYNSDSYLQDGTFISSTIKSETISLTDKYDEYVKSGGTMKQIEYISTIYSDFFANNQNNDYLHLDLIGLGIDRGYYDGIAQIDKYLISLYDIAYILDDCLDMAFGSNQYYYLFEQNIPEDQTIAIKMEYSKNIGTSNDDVLDKMHELTEQNIPYIFVASSFLDSSKVHFMVGYGAEKQNGEIVDYKLHTGWWDSPHTTFNTTEYNSNIGVLWLEINENYVPHVCSDNYVIDNEKYCSCQVYGDLHPEHIHEPTETCYMYTSEYHAVKCLWDTAGVIEDHKIENFKVLSSDTHKEYCFCGYGYEEEHSVSWWQRSDTNHTSICECGYRYTEPHNFIEQDYHTSVCADCGETVTTPHESEVYEQLSATQHLVVCGCGYEGEAPHVFTCVSISSSMHRMTCVCGYTTLDIHNFRSSAINPRYETCTACGYTRDNLGPGGGNIIMGKKEDEETE